MLCFLAVLCMMPAVMLEAGNAKRINKQQDRELAIRGILAKYYKNCHFYVGCAAKTMYTQDGNPEGIIFNREFSYNTPENDFKQEYVYTSPNAVWNDGNYKKQLSMAREQEQVVRAHGPVSPQCSKWVREDIRTDKELEYMMTSFMTSMSVEVQKNKDVIKWMDVVNETILNWKREDDRHKYLPGDWFGPLTGVDKWENPWLKIGQEDESDLRVPAYIIAAFEIADRYAPDVKLLYNHQGMMEEVSWEKIKKTIIYLRQRGLRVDALGWQAHIPLGFEKIPGNMKKLNALIDWCHANEIEFHVTELDVKMGTEYNPRLLKEKEQEIADTYGAVFETMLKKMGKGAVAVNCWSFKDRMSKYEGYFAGLFDSNNNPSEAYFRIKDLLIKYAPGI